MRWHHSVSQGNTTWWKQCTQVFHCSFPSSFLIHECTHTSSHSAGLRVSRKWRWPDNNKLRWIAKGHPTRAEAMVKEDTFTFVCFSSWCQISNRELTLHLRPQDRGGRGVIWLHPRLEAFLDSGLEIRVVPSAATQSKLIIHRTPAKANSQMKGLTS